MSSAATHLFGVTRVATRAPGLGSYTQNAVNVHLCHTSLVFCNYGLPEQHMQACILDNQ